MTPEEQLDRMIEARNDNGSRRPVGDDEVTARLRAADTLAGLNQIEVPEAFAARLEARVRQRARSLNQHNNRFTFVPRASSSEKARPLIYRRAWVTALAMAATLLVACVGAFTAAASSLPGDPLYGVKQFEQQVSLTFAGDAQGRAQVSISHLRSAVADLTSEVADGRSDADIMQALAIVANNTRDSQAAVAAIPAGPDHDTAQQDLAGALADEDQALRQALSRVDWALRVAFTSQLGALGDAVPTITQISVQEQNDNSRLVTITGTNFTPQTVLVINGAPGGTVISQTPTRLVVLVGQNEWSGSHSSLGVQNADGTAAQGRFDDDGHDGGDDNNGGTPGATRTPDDDGDDHGGSGGGSSGSGSSGGGSNSTPTPTSTSGGGGGGGGDDGGH
jgi:uncharacterized membrane protein YgcG